MEEVILTAEQRHQLLQAAIFSPFADNSQSFTIQWDPELTLWLDKSSSGRLSDIRFLLSDIAMGGVIESLVIQARSMGLETKTTTFPDKTKPELIAVLRFEKVAETENMQETDIDLAKQLSRRCTDRRFPFQGSIKPLAKTLMTQAVEARGAQLLWFEGKKAIAAVVPLIRKAESLRFKSRELHNELFSTIDFAAESQPQKGMSLANLNVEWFARPVFKALRNWTVMRISNVVGGAWLIGQRSVTLPIKLSPALALLTIEKTERIDILQAGRALLRCWLIASQQGLSLQPYAAPGVFSLGFISQDELLNRQAQEIANELGTVTGDLKGLIFLRVGYCSGDPIRSGRPEVQSTYTAMAAKT